MTDSRVEVKAHHVSSAWPDGELLARIAVPFESKGKTKWSAPANLVRLRELEALGLIETEEAVGYSERVLATSITKRGLAVLAVMVLAGEATTEMRYGNRKTNEEGAKRCDSLAP